LFDTPAPQSHFQKEENDVTDARFALARR